MKKSKIILFILAFIIWIFLNWKPDWQHLLVGFFIAVFVSYITGDLFIYRAYILKNPLRYWYFAFYYIPIFLWECVKANFDVAYRVIHPALPINPGIVKVKTSLKTDTGLTFLANSITLMPGTLVVDVNREEGVVYVHWIDVKSKDVEAATKIIVERFEKILKKIFE